MGSHETVQGMTPGSRWPAGRFKRLTMEFEVEVVDEAALRSSDLHATADENGNLTGVIDMDINERVGFALSSTFFQAAVAAESVTGIRVLSASGPLVRPVDESGNYPEMTYPAMPQRREDGTFDDVPDR